MVRIFPERFGSRPKDALLEHGVGNDVVRDPCIFIEAHPQPLYALFYSHPLEYDAYVPGKWSFIYSFVPRTCFFLLLPAMKRTLTITLDFDWFWRRAHRDLGSLLKTSARSGKFSSAVWIVCLEYYMVGLKQCLGMNGIFARPWPIGCRCNLDCV